MTGQEYEQFVRAVLCHHLGLDSSSLKSMREPGVTLPGGANLKHQIDLYHVKETEIAKYTTIIECKYRSSGLVDQQEMQNLAFVKENTRAHKAIMVTNKGFTSGAKAVADSQEIALLVIEPAEASIPHASASDVDEVFAAAQEYLARKSTTAYKMTVTRKICSDSSSSVFDSLDELLADPEVRRQAEKLLDDPNIRKQASRIAADNPDIARKAMDFFNKGGW